MRSVCNLREFQQPMAWSLVDESATQSLRAVLDFCCPSLVVIMRNHSYFLIFADFHTHSLPNGEVGPTYSYPQVLKRQHKSVEV